MKTDTTKQERISALLDNQLTDAQLDMALASLSAADHAESKEAWEIYHQIGDVLRSDDLSFNLSADFSSKMKALLDAEPVVLAPQRQLSQASSTPAEPTLSFTNRSRFSRYMTMSGVAAAVLLAFVLVPQIPSNSGGDNLQANFNTQANVAQINTPSNTPSSASQNSSLTNGDLVQLVSNTTAPEVKAKLSDQIEMLRDPRLDSYLQAHQKFSPSIENGTQYATRANVPYSSSAAPASLVSEK